MLKLKGLLVLCSFLGTCAQFGLANTHSAFGVTFDCNSELFTVAIHTRSHVITVEDIVHDNAPLVGSFGIDGSNVPLYLLNSQNMTTIGASRLDTLRSVLREKFRYKLTIRIDSTNKGLNNNVYRFLHKCDSTTILLVSGQTLQLDSIAIHAFLRMRRCHFRNSVFMSRDDSTIPDSSTISHLWFEDCIVDQAQGFSELCDGTEELLLENVRNSKGRVFLPELATRKNRITIYADCLDARHFQRMRNWSVATLSVFESCNELFPTVLLDIEGIQRIVYRGQLTGFDDWSHVKYRNISLNLNGNQISELPNGWEYHFAYNSIDNTLDDNPLSERFVRYLISQHRSFRLPLGGWLLPYLEIRPR